MDIRIEPPMSDWRVTRQESAAREALARLVKARAERLGLSGATLDPDKPIIATGHQAWLWHPGILAKDIAARMGAEALGAQPLHLVVDQDVHDALHLTLPAEDGDRLSARTVRLAHQQVDVPTGMQPPVDSEAVRATLQSLDDSRVAGVVEAWRDLPAAASLAEQLGVVLCRLMQPWAGPMPLVMTSDLAKLTAFDTLVSQMLHRARECAAAYNAAVAADPGAGIGALITEPHRVELPLWAERWGAARQRVFADLADTEPWLVFASGEQIDQSEWTLLPRALTMTAFLRSAACDLFVHGTGGWRYDRITENWWQKWTGETLAPMAVATANVYLSFAAPVADRADERRAVWRRHHLPHNVDRYLSEADRQAEQEQIARKRWLIEHMDDDRDASRRAAAFAEIHAINAELLARHPDLLEAADESLVTARRGRRNAAVAAKRDWCFALYPAESLQALTQQIRAEASPLAATSGG